MTDHSPTIQGAELPAHKGQYLCYAWGESDRPVAAIVKDRADVRQFLIDQWLGDEDATDYDGTPSLPGLMAEFDAPEWDMDDTLVWKFEIGGVSITKIFDVSPEADRASRAAGQTWQPIATAPKDERSLLWSSRNDRMSIDSWGHYDIHNQPKFSHWMPLPAAPGAAPQSSTLAPEASAAQPAPAPKPNTLTLAYEIVNAGHLIRDARRILWRWVEIYGKKQPHWLPPAGHVEWCENATEWIQRNPTVQDASTPSPAQVVSEASPDVANMVEACKDALSTFETICNYADSTDLGPTIIEEIGGACDQLRDALGAAATQAVDAYPALQALTEAVLTRADNDYMDRQIDAAVKVMASRGWLPPVPWPRRDEGSLCPASESTATQARAAAPAMAREPLSEFRIHEIARDNGDESDTGFCFNKGNWMSVVTFARDLEAEHGITADSARAAASEPLSLSEREVKR